MQGTDFEQYLCQFPVLKKHFIGIFSIDTVPKSIKYRQFCICNTDLHTESGQHWFCFLRNSTYEIECFDSLGINLEKKEKLTKYCTFKRIKQLKYNETSFQSKDSNTCGLFTIYFLIERMHNLDMTFDELLDDIFEEDKVKNEQKVSKFCNAILNSNNI